MNITKLIEKIATAKKDLMNSRHFPEDFNFLIAVVILVLVALFLSCPGNDQPTLQCPDVSVYEECDSALADCEGQLDACYIDGKQAHEQAEQALREIEEKNKLLDKKQEQNKKDQQVARDRRNSENARIETAEPRELFNVLNSKYN